MTVVPVPCRLDFAVPFAVNRRMRSRTPFIAPDLGPGGRTIPTLELTNPVAFAYPRSAQVVTDQGCLARMHTPFPDMQLTVEAYSATFESLHTELPGLAGRLVDLVVPTLFIHGASSPMPVAASTDTAHAIGPAAAVQVLDGAGHFPWLDRPGVVRAALDHLVNE